MPPKAAKKKAFKSEKKRLLRELTTKSEYFPLTKPLKKWRKFVFMSQTGKKFRLRRANEAFLWTKQTYFWEMVQNYDFSEKKRLLKKGF